MLLAKYIFNFILITFLMLCGYYFIDGTQNYWIILSALAMQTCLMQITRKYFLKLFLIALVSVAIVFIMGVVSNTFISTMVLLFVIFSSTYFCLIYKGNWGISLLINFLAIISSFVEVNTVENVERLQYMLFAFFIVMSLDAFLIKRLDTAKVVLKNCMRSLSHLNQSIFNCFLAQDYVEKKYFYEKEQHAARSHFLSEINSLRSVIQRLSQHNKMMFNFIEVRMSCLYEVILALGLALYRVEDHSVFSVANKELHALYENINVLLNDLIKKISNNRVSSSDDSLKENISSMEEIYHSVIQVVSPDPKIFLFFIHELHALNGIILELLIGVDRINKPTVKHD